MSTPGDIIARIEHVRLHFRLSKSRFADSFGMDPQSYETLLDGGVRGPNLTLLHGIADEFGVHPLWLLTGRGPMLMGDPKADAHSQAVAGVHPKPQASAKTGRDLDVTAMNAAFARIAELLSKLDDTAALAASERLALLERVSNALARYLAQYPQLADAELAALLEKIEQRLGGAHLRN